MSSSFSSGDPRHAPSFERHTENRGAVSEDRCSDRDRSSRARARTGDDYGQFGPLTTFDLSTQIGHKLASSTIDPSEQAMVRVGAAGFVAVAG